MVFYWAVNCQYEVHIELPRTGHPALILEGLPAKQIKKNSPTRWFCRRARRTILDEGTNGPSIFLILHLAFLHDAFWTNHCLGGVVALSELLFHAHVSGDFKGGSTPMIVKKSALFTTNSRESHH